MPPRRPIKRKTNSSSPPRGKPTRQRRGPVKRSRPTSEQPAGEQTGERLQKVLAQAGVASRRECEELIRDGRVEIDRKMVTELGTRVDPLKQEIRVDGEALARPKLVYYAVNKPVGVVSTLERSGRPTASHRYVAARIRRGCSALAVWTWRPKG